MDKITKFPLYCSSLSGVWHYAIINEKLCISICAEPGLENIGIVQVETALVGGFIDVEKEVVDKMFLKAQREIRKKMQISLEDVNLFDCYEDNDLKRDLALKYNIPMSSIEIK